MNVNREEPHILVLPEDDAYRQIVNGLCLDPNVNSRAIQLLSLAKGWKKAFKIFEDDLVPEMKQYPERRMVLLIDFDVKGHNKSRWNYEKKLSHVEERKSELKIPDALKDRVFVLGVLSQPENLKTDLKHMSLEKIGETLATGCPNHRNELWGHEILKHNQPELERMMASVKSFLFNNFL